MEELFKKLKIKIKNKNLYYIAFSHSSYANEHHKNDYERLEFLGDAVLELVISDYLYRKLNVAEGDMTKLRASYVCENALYEYAKALDLSSYIKVGHGEELTGGRFKKVIMADIFESLMGSIYLDLGFDTVKKVILDIIVPYIEDDNINFFSDYKSVLQEAMQTEKRTIEYILVNESGPSHQKEFTTEVRIDNITYGKGISHSKKESEQEAAKDALSRLAK